MDDVDRQTARHALDHTPFSMTTNVLLHDLPDEMVMEDSSEESALRRYRQRDLVPSHLLRLGMRLFSNQRQPVRRRIIDAQFYGPPERLPHPNAPKPR